MKHDPASVSSNPRQLRQRGTDAAILPRSALGRRSGRVADPVGVGPSRREVGLCSVWICGLMRPQESGACSS